MSVTIHVGDCIEVLRTLPAKSVHCVVTSPPYFGLRDYQTAEWEGGDAECDHTPNVKPRTTRERKGLTGGLDYMEAQEPVYRDACAKCGAIRIDRQIGLEQSPDAYVAKLVEVFREVRRVLHPAGTVWLNIGDSYASSGVMGSYSDKSTLHKWRYAPESGRAYDNKKMPGRAPTPPGLKPKDLMMIPARVALALQADGWWLRSDIIWHKPNGMPESVTDRPTNDYEHVFLLAKSERYFYDADAIREPVADYERPGGAAPYTANGSTTNGVGSDTFHQMSNVGRNKRAVWTIQTRPYSAAHFATFPADLVEPMIKAGTSERGACPGCGAQWERVIEKPDMSQRPLRSNDAKYPTNGASSVHIGNNWGGTPKSAGQAYQAWRNANPDVTAGWRPSCSCPQPAERPVPAVVLDMFGGAGTTGLVADRLGRDAILIELNSDYADMAARRIYQDAGMFADVEVIQ